MSFAPNDSIFYNQEMNSVVSFNDTKMRSQSDNDVDTTNIFQIKNESVEMDPNRLSKYSK